MNDITRFAIMVIYLGASPRDNFVKIGSSMNYRERQRSLLTGCPPRHEPDADIEFRNLWQTSAKNEFELRRYEFEVHNHFHAYRRYRKWIGDSEWFDLIDKIDEVDKFITSQPWFVGRIDPDNDQSAGEYPTKCNKHLTKCYKINTGFQPDKDKRTKLLCDIQFPIVTNCREFISNIVDINASINVGDNARHIVAPCGLGKTRIICESLRDLVDRCVICVPHIHLQKQWQNELVDNETFKLSEICFVGGDPCLGTASFNDADSLATWIGSRDKYCIISTNSSTTILATLFDKYPEICGQIQVCEFDEAHHMAGVISKTARDDDMGIGKTRKFLDLLVEKFPKIKRLFTTFTPRNIVFDTSVDTATDDVKIMSMDDEAVFGTCLANINLRDTIKLGILPDYMIWCITGFMDPGLDENEIKAQLILEAWQAKEIATDLVTYAKYEKYVLNHMIIFARTNAEAKLIENYLRNNIRIAGGNSPDDSTIILRVKGGDNVRDVITNRFETAKRAIIINCRVLSEGIDIPIVDSVAVMYPKFATGDIAQTILRAGRWHENKSSFHVLLPRIVSEDGRKLRSDDMSGIEATLLSLASCDSQLADTLALTKLPTDYDKTKYDGRLELDMGDLTIQLESMMIEMANSDDITKISEMLTYVRKMVLSAGMPDVISLLRGEYKKHREFLADKRADFNTYSAIAKENNLPQDPAKYFEKLFQGGFDWGNYLSTPPISPYDLDQVMPKIVSAIRHELIMEKVLNNPCEYGYATIAKYCAGLIPWKGEDRELKNLFKLWKTHIDDYMV